MPVSDNFLGAFLALVSAVIWGGGDFTGGLATRRGSQYYVLVVSAFSGLVLLVIAAIVLREPFPSIRGIIWSMLAGAAGAAGIAALYRALSIGHAASVAPMTAVIAAALPVIFRMFTSGVPALDRMLGFGLAMLGIWLITGSTSVESRMTRQELLLAAIAGIGFGGFFLFLGQVEQGRVFTPLIISRCLTFVTGLVLMRINRVPFPAVTTNPYALLAGILDVGGNLFFVLSKQFTQLEISAVLSSFYPASTVLLASLILKEKITLQRWIGGGVCLLAIVFITR